MFPYIYLPTYRLGPFSVQAFGVLVAFAVILGTHIIRNRAEKMNLDVNLVIDGFFWFLPLGFFISHVVDVVCYYPERVAADPKLLLYVWAGISSYGGILGVGLVGTIYFLIKKVPVKVYFETFAYGFIPAFTIGRFACAVAHDHPGLWVSTNPKLPNLLGTFKESVGTSKIKLMSVSLPPITSTSTILAIAICSLLFILIVSKWREDAFFSKVPLLSGAFFALGFVLLYPSIPVMLKQLAVSWPTNWKEIDLSTFHWVSTSSSYTTKPRFDLGLIGALVYIILTLLTFIAAKKKRKVGFIVGLWMSIYAPVRFFMDFLRSADRRYFGLTPGQYMSMIALAVGLYYFLSMNEERWGDYGERRKQELEKETQKEEATEGA